MFFSKLSSHRHAMKTALAAASPLLAFQVRDHPIQEAAEPIAPRHKYEKRFTLDSSTAKTPLAINRLIVSTPGVTFVSFDENATVPSVKVSGELPEVIEAFDIEDRGPSSFEIRLHRRLDKRHYVLTEVSLPVAHALQTLEVRGSGTVVVEDRVLPTNDAQAAVAISLSGSGDVFATSLSDLNVGSLAIDVTGSGDVQFVAPSVTLRNALESKVSSSGRARVFVGSITAPRVELNTSGSGGMQIAALNIEALKELHATVSGSGSVKTIGESLKADSIISSVSGSGSASFITNAELAATTVGTSVAGSGSVNIASTNAKCINGKISVSGSGTVDARDLVANHAVANVSGSGSILVRASEAVEAITGGSGSVTVVGDLPPRASGNLRTQTEGQKPSKLETLAAKRTPSKASPTRVEALEKLTRFNGTLNVNSFSDFIDAVKLIWNHQKDDNIDVQMKFGSVATRDCNRTEP